MQTSKKTASKKTASTSTPSKKQFRVVDANGNTFRVVKSEDEAKALAEHIGGRVK